jgi:ubiquinone/menaquinone biosynthesis C-methylase UbiE
MKKTYVHGYDYREKLRLHDQATTLTELLHCDTSYPAGSRILEAGCGVGAQTIFLAHNSPKASITSIDISEVSLAEAKTKLAQTGCANVQFERADIFNLPCQQNSFDHIFICFVLEHLAHPLDALLILKNYLKQGGTITVIEGDHGSVYFHPDKDLYRTAEQDGVFCYTFFKAVAYR